MWGSVMTSRCWLLVFVICFSLAGIAPVFSGAVDVDLWCGSPSRVGFAGDSFVYSFDVGYVGMYSFVDLSFWVEGLPDDWSYRFVLDGFEVDMVRLLNESCVSLKLVVDVPVDALPGVYDFRVVVGYGHPPYESFLSFRAVVKPVFRSLSVSCMFLAKVVEVGGSVGFDLDLRYSGPGDVFNFSVLNLPSGWDVHFIYGGDEVLLLSLSDGDVVSLRVVFDVPSNALPGDYNLTLKFFSKFIEQMFNLIVRVESAVGLNRGLKLFVDYPVIDVEAGKFAYFTLMIRNVGVVDELVYLNVSERSSGWDVSFRVAGKRVHGLLVSAGGSSSVVVEITPPPFVELGEHRFNITVYSEDRVVWDSIVLVVNVFGSYSLRVYFPEFPSPYFSITSGESRSFTVTVENNGILNVTNLYLSIDVPSIDWEVEIEPKRVVLLRPGESVDFKVNLYVSTIVSAGDYFLTVKAVSDQVSSSSRDLRVSVTKPLEWGYVGAGLAVIAIVIVILIFRRVGRR